MDNRLLDHCPLCDAPLRTHEAMEHTKGCMKINAGLDPETRELHAQRVVELRAEVQRAEAARIAAVRAEMEAQRRRMWGLPPEG